MRRLHGGSQCDLELGRDCIEPRMLIAAFIEHLQEPCELNAINIPILRIRKLRLEEIK